MLKIGGEKVSYSLRENLLERAGAYDGTARIVITRSSKGVDRIVLRTSRATDPQFVANVNYAFAQTEPLAGRVATARIAQFVVERISDTEIDQLGFEKYRYVVDGREIGVDR